MLQNKRSIWTFLLSFLMFLLMAGAAFAGEADIKLPDVSSSQLFGWHPYRVNHSEFRIDRLRHRDDFRYHAVCANQESARA